MYTGSVVDDDYECKFTHLAHQVLPHIQKRRAIVYLDAAKDVPRLAIALCRSGLKSCAYHGKNMSTHDKLRALRIGRMGKLK